MCSLWFLFLLSSLGPQQWLQWLVLASPISGAPGQAVLRESLYLIPSPRVDSPLFPESISKILLKKLSYRKNFRLPWWPTCWRQQCRLQSAGETVTCSLWKIYLQFLLNIVLPIQIHFRADHTSASSLNHLCFWDLTICADLCPVGLISLLLIFLTVCFFLFPFFFTLISHCHDICAHMKCFACAGFFLQTLQGGKQINKQLVASECTFPMDVGLVLRQILSSDISPSSLFLK